MMRFQSPNQHAAAIFPDMNAVNEATPKPSVSVQWALISKVLLIDFAALIFSLVILGQSAFSNVGLLLTFIAVNGVIIHSQINLALGYRQKDWMSREWFSQYMDSHHLFFVYTKTLLTAILTAYFLQNALPKPTYIFLFHFLQDAPDLLFVGVIQGLISCAAYFYFERNIIDLPLLRLPFIRSLHAEYANLVYRVVIQGTVTFALTISCVFLLHPSEIVFPRQTYYLITMSCLLQTLYDEINHFALQMFLSKSFHYTKFDELVAHTGHSSSLMKLLAYQELAKISNHHQKERSDIFASGKRWEEYYKACMRPIRELNRALQNNRQEPKNKRRNEFALFSKYRIFLLACEALATMLVKAKKERAGSVANADIVRVLQELTVCEKSIELYLHEDASVLNTVAGHFVVGEIPHSALRAIRSAIYQITINFYDRLPAMSFNSFSAEQLQKYADFEK